MINIHGRSARNKTGELVESAVPCQEADEIKGQSVYVKQGLDSTSETNKMLPEQGSINEGKVSGCPRDKIVYKTLILCPKLMLMLILCSMFS